MREVLIITTGGTLEKVHDWRIEGLAFEPGGADQVERLLQDARCYHAPVQPLMVKDSLDFTDEDRQAILASILGATQDAVVVTHGTGTMGLTARFLDGRVGAKTVVLTGAMRPHSLGNSDASFNVGGAIVGAQLLPAGVYGVMNGRVFAARDLAKNTQLGRFDVAL